MDAALGVAVLMSDKCLLLVNSDCNRAMLFLSERWRLHPAKYPWKRLFLQATQSNTVPIKKKTQAIP